MEKSENLLNIYAGRRVLISGHTGFKGSWLAFWLHKLGARVLGLAMDPPGSPSLFADAALADILDDQRVDVRHASAVRNIVSDFKPEIVFHLAAQSLVRSSYEDPLLSFSTNVMGTVNMLEACRFSSSPKAVVIVTSDKCYQNNEWVWSYRENDPMGGLDPYSASKGCAELVTASYTASFFQAEKYGQSHNTAVASVRAGNVIGGGDWGESRLVPDCFRAFMQKRAVLLRYPNSVRPWQHVLDALYGYLILGVRLFIDGPAFAGGWNFAPLDRGEIWTVERVVQYLCRLWGDGAGYELEEDMSLHEAAFLSLDATKAFVKLGWRPRWSVAEALEKCAQWYKAWHADSQTASVRALMLRQLESYTSNIINL